jgi:cell shape-determining protein MreC
MTPDTLSRLEAENETLKKRVRELEDALLKVQLVMEMAQKGLIR